MKKYPSFAAPVLITIVIFLLGASFFLKHPSREIDTSAMAPVFSQTIDINGDNKNEKIDLFLSKSEGEGTKATLAVNDVGLNIPGGNPQSTFTVADIDTRDNVKEIAITDEGPSLDYVTRFYMYDGKSLHEVGEVPGALDQMVFSSEGMVSALARGEMFDTWFYRKTFLLSGEHVLEPVTKVFYPRVMPTDEVTLLTALPLSLEPKDESVTFVAPVRSQGAILGCDNISWCEARFNGKTGWFKVTNRIVISAVNLPMNEVFEGISMAD
jgi:hypothetical protein